MSLYFWNYQLDIPQLPRILEKILNSEPLPQNDFQILKTIRKKGLLLRYLFISIDDSHKAPVILDQWVKWLGKLNDSITNERNDLSYATAEKLIGIDINKINNSLEKFKASGKKSTQSHLSELFRQMNKLLKAEKLKISDFHTLRKNLRQVQTILRVQQSLNPSEEKAVLIDKIHKLNQMTGFIHDKYVNESLTLDNSIYENSTLSIPKDLKKHIKKIIESISIN